MTHVVHDKTLEAPTTKEPKPKSVGKPPQGNRQVSWLRWAAVLLGGAMVAVLVVLAMNAPADTNNTIEADSLVIFDGSQTAPRVAAGFAPTGWEQPEVSLVIFDSTVAARVPPGYAPVGWVPPETGFVLYDVDALRTDLPEGYIPISE